MHDCTRILSTLWLRSNCDPDIDVHGAPSSKSNGAVLRSTCTTTCPWKFFDKTGLHTRRGLLILRAGWFQRIVNFNLVPMATFNHSSAIVSRIMKRQSPVFLSLRIFERENAGLLSVGYDLNSRFPWMRHCVAISGDWRTRWRSDFRVSFLFRFFWNVPYIYTKW